MLALRWSEAANCKQQTVICGTYAPSMSKTLAVSRAMYQGFSCVRRALISSAEQDDLHFWWYRELPRNFQAFSIPSLAMLKEYRFSRILSIRSLPSVAQTDTFPLCLLHLSENHHIYTRSGAVRPHQPDNESS